MALALAIGALRPDGELSGAVLILSQAVALVAVILLAEGAG